MTCATCRDLLNEALNLAVRSDQFEEQLRRKAQIEASGDGEEWVESGRFDRHVERHNINYPHQKIATRSATLHVWVLDQYDKDFADWQARARNHLTQGCDT